MSVEQLEQCRQVRRRKEETFLVDTERLGTEFRDTLRACGSDGTTVACSSSGTTRELMLWSILICHPHLTSIIICRTAVWAQAFGSEHKTSCVIIVHFWLIRCPSSFVVAVGVYGGSSITILLFLLRIIWTFATVTIFVLCVLVSTFQYHDTVVFFCKTLRRKIHSWQRSPAWDEYHGKTMRKS